MASGVIGDLSWTDVYLGGLFPACVVAFLVIAVLSYGCTPREFFAIVGGMALGALLWPVALVVYVAGAIYGNKWDWYA